MAVFERRDSIPIPPKDAQKFISPWPVLRRRLWL